MARLQPSPVCVRISPEEAPTMLHKSVNAGCAAAVLFAFGASAPLMAQTEAEIEVQLEVPTPPEEDAQTEVVGGATLYQRIGGYDLIAEIVDDFFGRMAEDERLRGYFAGLSEDTMRQVRQDTVDFVCEKTGGPCFYTGRDMAKVREGTEVSPADWERATELMAATLDARGVQGELRDEIGTFLAGLRKDIVDEK
jgi:hemoglobin